MQLLCGECFDERQSRGDDDVSNGGCRQRFTWSASRVGVAYALRAMRLFNAVICSRGASRALLQTLTALRPLQRSKNFKRAGVQCTVGSRRRCPSPLPKRLLLLPPSVGL